jgi:hypothetical protein
LLVTATSSTGVTKIGYTGDDGCVLLDHLSAGDWTLRLSTSGYVTKAGDPTATLDAHVQPGKIWRGSIAYAQAAAIDVTIDPAPGSCEEASTSTACPRDPAPDVQNLPVTLSNSAIQPIGVRSVAGSGASRRLANLWPDPSGYLLWAGGCEDGAPTDDSRATTVEAGETTPTIIRLGAIDVHAPPGTEVTATHSPDRLCTSETTIRIGTTNADGLLEGSLPYGAWQIGGGDRVLIGPGIAQEVTLG